MKSRTHRCGELNKSHVGKTVVLNGWVQRRRDHGMVMFIDLRDRTGITQVVFNAERNAAVHKAAHTLRSECVVSVAGQVMARPDESKNPNLSTGEIEIFVDAVDILTEAKTVLDRRRRGGDGVDPFEISVSRFAPPEDAETVGPSPCDCAGGKGLPQRRTIP
jgi:aspartyl/asparaginyl-tRNA synthetase